MGKYCAESLVKLLIRNDLPVKNARVAILGFTFKENCPDTRNSKVIDIYKELQEYGITPMVVDPQADAQEAKRLYGIEFRTMEDVKDMDAVLIAVKHTDFENLTREKIADFYNPAHQTKVFVDLKGMFDRTSFAAPEWDYWRL
jgi:UDP-N-acetyl-D-glucosamine/UDP-N-acetyl-D-galactosamine dehydrogenase